MNLAKIDVVNDRVQYFGKLSKAAIAKSLVIGTLMVVIPISLIVAIGNPYSIPGSNDILSTNYLIKLVMFFPVLLLFLFVNFKMYFIFAKYIIFRTHFMKIDRHNIDIVWNFRQKILFSENIKVDREYVYDKEYIKISGDNQTPLLIPAIILRDNSDIVIDELRQLLSSIAQAESSSGSAIESGR